MHPFGAFCGLTNEGFCWFRAWSVRRKTLEMLLRAHQAEVYRYVKYLGAGDDLAQDLVQETFLTTFRDSPPPSLDDARRSGAWLRGIARNLLLRHWAKEKRSPVTIDGPMLEQAEEVWAATFTGGDDGSQYLEALRECLKAVPARGREILDLRYAEKKTRREIADALSMTVDGIKSALQRIRARLSKCVRARLRLEGA